LRTASIFSTCSVVAAHARGEIGQQALGRQAQRGRQRCAPRHHVRGHARGAALHGLEQQADIRPLLRLAQNGRELIGGIDRPRDAREQAAPVEPCEQIAERDDHR
jgi:hypothetical protein